MIILLIFLILGFLASVFGPTERNIPSEKKKELSKNKLISIDYVERKKKSDELDAEAYFLKLDLGSDNFELVDLYKTELYKKKKNETLELLKNQEDFLNPIINFIAIRYYLTGNKCFPKTNILTAYINNKFPEIDSIFDELIWNYCLDKLELDSNKIKNIKALYHFTHKNNLPSILSKGLLTKSFLEENNFEYKYNDIHRWDNLENSISLSFSHPNHKMFMKYAKPQGLENWVVIQLTPKLLSGSIQLPLNTYNYLDKAIFNRTNAASFAIKKLSVHERKSYKSFLEIFESPIGKTLETYPVDNQAEILYQSNIPHAFIEEIHLFEEDPNLSWVSDLGFKLSISPILFKKR